MVSFTTILLVSLAVAADKPAEKPAWVDRPPGLQGTVYHTVVKSGLFVTTAECQQAIEPKLRDAARHYLDEFLTPEASSKVAIDADLLGKLRKDSYQETVRSATVGPMRQLHVLLEFDDAARSEMIRRCTRSMVNARLRRLAIASGAALALLALAAAYLKRDLRKQARQR